MLDVKTGQLGATQSSSKTDQQKSAVTQACKIVVANVNQPADFCSGQSSRPAGRFAVCARDSAQGFADRRMARVQRLLGDPVRTCDGGDPAPQGRQGVAETGGGEVGPDGLRGGRHRFEIHVPRTTP